MFCLRLDEGLGVAQRKRRKKFEIFKKYIKKFYSFSLRHPRPLMSVHKKCQPIRSSCVAGYRQQIYKCLVFI